MPPNFDRLIGVDSSNEMIAYAQKTHSQPNIEFRTFDIVNGDTNELPQVDHVTSLYVFHHIYDHEKAVRNIYDLLKPGGDCFITFLAKFEVYTAFEQTARSPKWSKYIKNLSEVLIPTEYSKNTASDFGQLLEKCRFSSVEISFKEGCIEMGTIDVLKDLIKTIREFFKELLLEEHDAFAVDVAKATMNAYNTVPYNKHSIENEISQPFGTLIAYARK